MKILFIFFFSLVLSVDLFCQDINSEVKAIKTYVRKVDSLTNINTYLNADGVKGYSLVTSIAEGSIGDKKRRHGFTLETTTSVDEDSVFLIRQRDNLYKNLIQSYYFRSDKLVFSRIELIGDDDLNQLIYWRENYYSNDKLIYESTTGSRIRKREKRRIDINPLTSGYYYLKTPKR